MARLADPLRFTLSPGGLGALDSSSVARSSPWALRWRRWFAFRRANTDSDALLRPLFALIEQGKIQDAIALCAATGGPVAETMGIGLRKLMFLERIGKKPEEIEEGIVAAMEDHGGHVVD